MTETVDVYWSFRSPYSYLVTPDLLKLKRDFDVEVKLRVVFPIAVRSKGVLFDPNNKIKVSYIILDCMRRAEYLGMKIGVPMPDPIVQDMETFQVAEEQPHIYRLSKLGVEANRQGKGIEFAANVSALIFGGTINWHEGDYLANAAQKAGLNLKQMELAIQDGDHLEEVQENHQSLENSGHWGVPTMVVKGEPFFGQDRINTLRWRLKKLGVEN